MKKIISIVLSAILVLSMQPINVIAADSVPDFIEIDIDTNIADVPVADYEQYVSFNDAFDYFEHASNGAVSAYCMTDSADATVFEEGKEYRLTINVTGAEGYAVGTASTVECTINGSAAIKYAAQEMIVGSDTCYYFAITYEFAVPAKTMVDTVAIEIPLDLNGVSVDDYTSFISLSSANVEFGSMPGEKPVYFYGKNGGTVSELSYSKEYSLYISLEPREGFKFPEAGTQIACTINGTSVNGTVSSTGLLEIYFEGYKTLKSVVFADFEYANYKKGLAPSGIRVTTQKQGISVEHAFLANIDGVVVTDEQIAEGMDYLLLVYFKADDGYLISELQEEGITVAGNEVEDYIYDGGSKMGCISYALPVLVHQHSGGTATCISKKKCSECFTDVYYGDLDPNNHVGDTEVKNKKDATCKEKGYTGDVYCLDCGNIATAGVEIPKSVEHTGATEIRNKKDATCKEKGYTGDVYCLECENVATAGVEIPKSVEHTGATELRNKKTATCKDEGYTGDAYCLCCGEKVKTGESIKKLEHVYDSGVVTKNPTEQETGITTYTCKICSRTKTEVIPMLTKKAPAKGKTLIHEKTGATYKVTNSSLTNGTVTFVKPKNKQVTKGAIPEKVTIDGITYKVTGISANAFKGCKKLTSLTIGMNVASIGKSAFDGCTKLKNITIKTTKLKSSKVGAKAFRNVSKKAVVKVPAKKLKAYKKFLYKKGLNKKVTIKKNS